MEELKPIEKNSTKNNNNNNNNNTKKNIKDMSIEEQTEYYKNLLQKSKKLNRYYDEENKKLKEKLSQYEGEEDKKCNLLLIFKHENENFYLFKNEKNKYFINEKLLAESFIKEIKNNKSIKTYDYINDLKAKDDYLTQIINQYEDKLKRIVKENELNESKISKQKINNNKLLNDIKINEKKYEECIKNCIQHSNDIFINLKNIFDVDLSENSVKKEVYNKINTSINNLSNEINLDKENIWGNELILFIQKILNNYLDLSYKIIDNELNEFNQKQKYQTMIDQLLLTQQEEKNKMFKLNEEHKNSIKNLNQKISSLEQEIFDLNKQKDLSNEMLNKQINKEVNLFYLKKIMISFLTTNDESIKDGLLPVIYTGLQFNESEIKQINDYKEKPKKSLLSIFS